MAAIQLDAAQRPMQEQSQERRPKNSSTASGSRRIKSGAGFNAPLVGAVGNPEAVGGAVGLGVGEVVNQFHLLHQVTCTVAALIFGVLRTCGSSRDQKPQS